MQTDRVFQMDPISFTRYVAFQEGEGQLTALLFAFCIVIWWAHFPPLCPGQRGIPETADCVLTLDHLLQPNPWYKLHRKRTCTIRARWIGSKGIKLPKIKTGHQYSYRNSQILGSFEAKNITCVFLHENSNLAIKITKDVFPDVKKCKKVRKSGLKRLFCIF